MSRTSFKLWGLSSTIRISSFATAAPLPFRAGSVGEERRNERIRIRRLGQQRLLSRSEQDIGRRKDPRPRPRHLGDAILVEQSPALVGGFPWGGPVHHRLGE